MNQRGFTLIEMSIVLVIIGLIVGGILKGQELIESSRQKNMVSQIDRIRAGVTAFSDRFKSLPGDYSRVSMLPNASLIGTTGGNDNGVVGALSTNIITDTMATQIASTSENVKFFNHLILTNLASSGSATNEGVTLACFAGNCATSSPLPPAAFPQSGFTVMYGTHPGFTVGSNQPDTRQAHWLFVSRFLATAISAETNGVVSAARAYQVDSKYDDGGAGSGNIRTGLNGSGCGTTSADYTPGTTTVSCALVFTLE